jgi:hypothetical protein
MMYRFVFAAILTLGCIPTSSLGDSEAANRAAMQARRIALATTIMKRYRLEEPEYVDARWTQAVTEASKRLERTAKWVEKSGDLSTELSECATESETANGLFAAGTAWPQAGSPELTKLCEMLTPGPQDFGPGFEMQALEDTCEFVQPRTCAFEFRRRYVYRSSKSSLVDKGLSPFMEDRMIVIQCRAVAALGLKPGWVCGAAHNTVLFTARLHGFDVRHRIAQGERDGVDVFYKYPNPDPILEKNEDPDFLRKFLSELKLEAL